MPIWIFRISTLVAFAFLTYNFISRDWMSVLGGLLCLTAGLTLGMLLSPRKTVTIVTIVTRSA